jgi:ribonuclease PH
VLFSLFVLLFCRRVVLQSGVVSAAVGSAYVERQGTKVLCAMSVFSFFFPARVRSSTAARLFLRDCC